MSTRHVKPPTPLFLFFLPVPRFSCSTAPQGFSRPDRVLSQAGGRRCCQGWPLFSGHPSGAPAFTAIEHDGRLDRSGRLHSLLVIYVYPSWCQRALFRSRMLFSAGLATKSMARAIIASTYIRQLRSGLPRCCLHGRSPQEGWDSSLGRQIGKCRFAIRFYSHTSDPPDTPETGVSELSAVSTLSE